MGSLRSFGTWPHPNHQQPITEQENREKQRERERENHAAKKFHIVSKRLESKYEQKGQEI